MAIYLPTVRQYCTEALKYIIRTKHNKILPNLTYHVTDQNRWAETQKNKKKIKT